MATSSRAPLALAGAKPTLVPLLEQMGLTAGESKAFLALCQSGPATVSDVAARAGVHRAAAYNTLNQLVAKGMASFAVVNGKRTYQAATPSEIGARLDAQQAEARDAMHALSVELSKMNLTTVQPKVSAFFGLEGLKTVLNEELEAAGDGGTIRALRVVAQIAYLAPVFVTWWHKRRVSRQISFHGIIDSGDVSRQRGKELRKFPLTQIRHERRGVVEPVAYLVAGNKVFIISTSSTALFAVVIEDPAIAKSFQERFETEWNRLG